MWLYGLVGAIIICFGFVVLRGAPYVPSHRRQVRRAFTQLYRLTPGDRLVDLGSGDGVVLRQARRCGATAIGYELNPLLVWLARAMSHGDRGVTVMMRDYLLIDTLPPGVTVVYAFTTSHSIAPIGRKLAQWSADTTLYFISYGFELPDKKPLRRDGPMILYKF